MFKKYLTLSLVFLVINLFFSTTGFAETKTEKEAKFAEKVKTQIKKLGVGTEARIEVKLKDGTKLKGYVNNIGEESFSVTNDKTGISTEIPYSNAKQIKGNNLSTGAKILIGLGIAVLVLFIIGWYSQD